MLRVLDGTANFSRSGAGQRFHDLGLEFGLQRTAEVAGVEPVGQVQPAARVDADCSRVRVVAEGDALEAIAREGESLRAAEVERAEALVAAQADEFRAGSARVWPAVA